jgi:hypothetical protein
VKTG